MGSAALKLGPAPNIALGTMVWCRSANSYDCRKLIAWVHDAYRGGWRAQVQGRGATVKADDVYEDRVKCHDSLIRDMEARYERHIGRCRKLRQLLDGLRSTRRENWSKFIGKISDHGPR